MGHDWRAALAQQIADEILGYGPLEPLLRDAEVTEVMVNGFDTVYVERFGKIEQVEMLERGAGPLREFMLKQTRPEDVRRMVRLSRQPVVTGEQVPFVTLMAAFTISELRTAFAIGFALFLPFIVIDVVVASVLMSLGMFMLPPTMIALPFKLLLFVLVDGWGLITQSLVAGFR